MNAFPMSFLKLCAPHWRREAPKGPALRQWVGCVMLAGLWLLSACSQAGAEGLPLLSPARVDALRRDSQTWSKLHERCIRDLSARPSAVAVLEPGPVYTQSGKNEEKSGKQMAVDSRIAYRAALCFELSGDVRFAKQAQVLIDAWASTLREVKNQQGRNTVNFYLPPMIVAAMWVRGEAGWSGELLNDLILKVALPASGAELPNNHGNWGVLLEAASAAYLRDEALLAKVARRWEALLTEQVDDDGSLPREICRSATSNWCDGPDKGIRGIAYTHYTLLPASLAAEILVSNGHDVYAAAGGTALRKAYARAAEWTRDPSTFPYFESNGGRLQDVRSAAYFHVLRGRFKVAAAEEVLAAGLIDGDPYELKLIFGN